MERWSQSIPQFPLRSPRQRRDQPCKILLLFHTFKKASLRKHQLPWGWRSGEAGRGEESTARKLETELPGRKEGTGIFKPFSVYQRYLLT